MKFDAGTTHSSGQVSDTRDAVKAIEFHARSDNVGSVIVGVSDVSSSNGRELSPDASTTYEFGEGSVLLSVFYVHITGSGDSVDWSVIVL